MVLLAALQNPDSAAVHRHPVIAVRHRHPPLRPDLDEKRIQRNRVHENHRVRDPVNARRQNDVLSATLEAHDLSLVHSRDHQVSHLALNDIVLIILAETVDALQRRKVTQNVDARTSRY